MTLIDIIETGNLNTDRVLDDASWLYENIDIDERLDKEVLIDCLFDECGAMTAIYSTTRVFKKFSDNFFKKYKWNIGKMLDTMELKYNPLENMNKNWTDTTEISQELETEEEHEEGRTKVNTGTQEKDNTGTQNVANTGTQGTEYSDDTDNTVSAMNSDDYQPDSKSENEGSNTRTDNLNELRTDDLKETRTDNLTETIGAATNRTKNESLGWEETDTHTESGSDRVVFQDLVKKEREVAKFSVYNWISRMYAKELFLMVY